MFYAILRYFNIEYLLIPLQQPKSNVKAERFQMVVDDEFNLAIREKSLKRLKKYKLMWLSITTNKELLFMELYVIMTEENTKQSDSYPSLD